jgi:hypothetical protein
METLLNIALNVNGNSSDNVFLNDRLQTIIDNLSFQEKISLLEQANKARLVHRLSTILDRKEIKLQETITSFLLLFDSSHTRNDITSLLVRGNCGTR